jgi:site-specific recombinase XerC
MKPTSSFATLLQRFFTQRLMQQRQASPHTISSYRDTFRLLLQFALKRLHMQPARVAFEDIDAPLISAFLDELQNSRGITARSRNIRLPPFAHSSTLPHSKCLPGPRKSSGCSRFQANDMPADRLPS